MDFSRKTRTQAGFLCECSGNIELHLAAKSLKYRLPSTVRGLRETVLLESGIVLWKMAKITDFLAIVQTTFEPTDKQNLYLRQPLGVYYARRYPLELIKTAVQAAEKAGDVDISDDHRTVTGADVIAARNRAEFEKLDGQIQAGWEPVERNSCIHV